MTGTQGSTGASEPTDNRRVIRLPRATRLLAAWLVCFAIAFAVVWFSPLSIEHDRSVSCALVGGGPCPTSYVCLRNGRYCWDPYNAWSPEAVSIVEEAHAAALPILVLRAAALGTVLWVAYLGVRAVRSRVRFKVG